MNAGQRRAVAILVALYAVGAVTACGGEDRSSLTVELADRRFDYASAETTPVEWMIKHGFAALATDSTWRNPTYDEILDRTVYSFSLANFSMHSWPGFSR